jgi:hypothetical protein
VCTGPKLRVVKIPGGALFAALPPRFRGPPSQPPLSYCRDGGGVEQSPPPLWVCTSSGAC